MALWQHHASFPDQQKGHNGSLPFQGWPGCITHRPGGAPEPPASSRSGVPLKPSGLLNPQARRCIHPCFWRHLGRAMAPHRRAGCITQARRCIHAAGMQVMWCIQAKRWHPTDGLDASPRPGGASMPCDDVPHRASMHMYHYDFSK